MPGQIGAWWITASVAIVVGGAPGRNVAPLWRLSKLPYFRKVYSAFGRTGGPLGKRATWRRRTSVIGNPIRNLSSACVLPDVFGRDDGHTLAFLRRDSGAINARTETSRGDAIHPGIEIGFLLWQHAAAFFLIDENDCSGGKTFLSCGCNSFLAVGLPQPRGIGYRFQLGEKASVEDYEKSEPGGLQCLPLPDP